ncbi:unnamed protein product, partial [marine sediment metagenome]
LSLMGYFLPITLTFVLPMAALFASALVYGRFASDNEFDACRASGISFLTLVHPGLSLAIVVAIANLVLSFHMLPFFVHLAEIYKKSNVRKMRTNYLKAAQLHQRLLYRPKAERKVPFIRNSQIRDELTEEEKNIVLATFDKGKVTMKDWFETLGEIVPPRRPQDLDTPQGVDALLEQSLRTPLLVSEAVSLGFDKDENLKKQVREYEDRILLGESKQARNKEVEDPTTEEMKAYLKEHEEQFRQDRKLKI